MPHKAESRLRDLIEELQRAQDEAGGLAERVRQDVAGAMTGAELRPVGTSGSRTRKKKAGKKKR